MRLFLAVLTIVGLMEITCTHPLGIDTSTLRDFSYVQPKQPTHPHDVTDLSTRATSHMPALRDRYPSHLNVPHVQNTEFTFVAFGREFHVPVTQRRGLLHPEFRSHVPDDVTGSLREMHGLEECFFEHASNNGVGGFLSTCHGMLMGFFETDDGETMFVEPVISKEKMARGDYSPDTHILYRLSDIIPDESEFCGVRESKTVSVSKGLSHFVSNEDRVARNKRFTGSTAYMAQLLILDATIYDQFDLSSTNGEEAVPALVWAATVFGVVTYNYERAPTSVPVQLQLKNILLWNSNTQEIDPLVGRGSDYLSQVSLWQSTSKETYDQDNTALFTFNEIVSGSSVAGLAGLGVQCSNSATSLNRANGGLHGIANVFAHELGHNWNLNHDTGEFTEYIMSPVSSNSQEAGNWGSFSSFSIEQFDTYLQGDLSCLLTEVEEPYGLGCAYAELYWPGKCYQPDEICQWSTGETSSVYTPRANCHAYWCSTGGGGGTTNQVAALEGSACHLDDGSLAPAHNESDSNIGMCLDFECVALSNSWRSLDCDQCLTEDPTNGFRQFGDGDGGDDFPAAAGIVVAIVMICYVLCAVGIAAIAIIAVVVALFGAGGIGAYFSFAANGQMTNGAPHGGDMAI